MQVVSEVMYKLWLTEDELDQIITALDDAENPNEFYDAVLDNLFDTLCGAQDASNS